MLMVIFERIYLYWQILICGQALSHCVNFTLRDIVKHWRGEMSKIVLLMDGMHIVNHIFSTLINIFPLRLLYRLFSCHWV